MSTTGRLVDDCFSSEDVYFEGLEVTTFSEVDWKSDDLELPAFEVLDNKESDEIVDPVLELATPGNAEVVEITC